MIWQYSPLSPLLIISAALTAVLAVIAWKNRRSPGGTALTIFLSAATIWSVAYALELCTADLESNLLFTNLEYLGIATIPPAFLAFALSYTGREHLLTRNAVFALSLVPALTLIAVFSNDLHHLYYTGFTPVVTGGVVIWQFSYGPLFWICWAAFGLQILAALALLVGHFFAAPDVYRSQIGLLLIASVVPIIANILYVLKMGPIPGFDPTPVGFLVTGLTLEMATIRYRLFSVTPVARSFLPGIMTDGVIVTNEEGRIVDINPAAASIAGIPEDAAIGASIGHVFPPLRQIVSRCGEDGMGSEAEVEMVVEGRPRVFISRCRSTGETSPGDAAGRLIVLHDVTDLLNEKAAPGGRMKNSACWGGSPAMTSSTRSRRSAATWNSPSNQEIAMRQKRTSGSLSSPPGPCATRSISCGTTWPWERGARSGSISVRWRSRRSLMPDRTGCRPGSPVRAYRSMPTPSSNAPSSTWQTTPLSTA